MNRRTDSVTLQQLLEQATRRIGGDSPRLDAEVLLAHVLGKPHSYLLTWPERVPDAGQRSRFDALVARRMAGEPVAHLTGQREFWSLSFGVTPDTLIPRPETETLVEQALARLPAGEYRRVADLGTGSGAVALAIAHERPSCRVVATEHSSPALDAARENALLLGIDNVTFVEGDWCEALDANRFDMIVSNPPYIPQDDPHLSAGDVRFEPRTALAAGPDGLSDLERIVRCTRDHLVGDGWLLLEHGFDQGPRVRALLEAAGYRGINTWRDATGHERVTAGICCQGEPG